MCSLAPLASSHFLQTLDIARGTFIVTASFGAERTIVLREKRTAGAATTSLAAPRNVQRIPLPHNSLFVLGWDSNRAYTHEIRADRRADALKRPAEVAHNGLRVSITFRRIATFLDVTTGALTGQGAPRPSSSAPHDDDDVDDAEYVRMIQAFSIENKLGNEFDWDLHYGKGFYLGRRFHFHE